MTEDTDRTVPPDPVETPLDPQPDDNEYQMELLLRSLAPTGLREYQESILREATELNVRGAIASHSVTVVGNRICPDGNPKTDAERAILRKVEWIRNWAAQQEVSLEPGFVERTVDSLVEGPYTVVIPPVISLVISDEEGLWGVFPCEIRGSTVSIPECLAEFRSGEPSMRAGRIPR